MEKNYSKKQYYLIGFSSLIISILGIILSFRTFTILQNSRGFISPERKFVELNWIFKPFTLFIGTTRGAFDLWELFLLAILLAGSIMFLLKKGKETRLIAFVFSVIFISNIVGFLNMLYFFFYIRGKLEDARYNKTAMVYLYPLMNVVYIFLSYTILTSIKKIKVLDVKQTEQSTTITDTPKWQRFFHYLIDTFIMLLVFCPLFLRLFDTALVKNQFFREKLNNESIWLLLVIILRFIYYPLFEILFNSTPAKFLTESRVIDDVAEKPSAGVIFKRTLFRSIPFNAVSFFWKTGWHDSLSYTHVVKEKRTGFKTVYLLIILAVLIPYVYLYYFGTELISDFKTSKINDRTIEYNSEFSKNSVENINKNQVFVIQPGGSSVYTTMALKVEDVKGDDVVCKVLVKKDSYEITYYDLEKLYAEQKDSASTYTFKKKDFVEAVPKNRMENDDAKRNGTYFFDKYGKYEISGIYTMNSPFIKEGEVKPDNSLDNNSQISKIYFKNLGKSGKIVSIKNIDGGVIWKDKFPISIKGSDHYTDEILVTTGNLKGKDEFIADMTILDSLKNEQKYRIEFQQVPYTQLKVYRLK